QCLQNVTCHDGPPGLSGCGLDRREIARASVIGASLVSAGESRWTCMRDKLATGTGHPPRVAFVDPPAAGEERERRQYRLPVSEQECRVATRQSRQRHHGV